MQMLSSVYIYIYARRLPSLPACLSTTGDEWRIDRIGSNSVPLLTEQLTSILPAFGCTSPEDCSHWWHCSEPLSSSYDMIWYQLGMDTYHSFIDRQIDRHIHERKKERKKERFRWNLLKRQNAKGKANTELGIQFNPIQSNPSDEWVTISVALPSWIKKTRQDKFVIIPFCCLYLYTQTKKKERKKERKKAHRSHS